MSTRWSMAKVAQSEQKISGMQLKPRRKQNEKKGLPMFKTLACNFILQNVGKKTRALSSQQLTPKTLLQFASIIDLTHLRGELREIGCRHICGAIFLIAN